MRKRILFYVGCVLFVLIVGLVVYVSVYTPSPTVSGQLSVMP